MQDIRAISFDCYGTLIDWQTGIVNAMQPIFERNRYPCNDDKLIRDFARLERLEEGPPYRSYKQVLEEVVETLLGRIDCPDREVLWRSIADWPAFGETPAALAALKSRYKLAVVSNIDSDLFELTRPKLGVELDEVVTAEHVRSYKPRPAHFHELFRRLDLKPTQMLHVAESRYHDIEPANKLVMPCVWVNRPGLGTNAVTASGPGGGQPTMTVKSLTELVFALGG